MRLLLAALLFAATPAAAQSIIAVDGDTLAIGAERIRIIGLDTPESYQSHCAAEAALGYQAAGRLQHLLAVRGVKIARAGRDKYGRTLARVWVGKDEVPAILVAEGLAVPYDGRTRRTYWARTLCGLAQP